MKAKKIYDLRRTYYFNRGWNICLNCSSTGWEQLVCGSVFFHSYGLCGVGYPQCQL